MSRAPLVRALIALGIVAGSIYVTVTTPARLGLDLRGGTQIVLETKDSPTVKAGTESTDRAVEVLRRRVDALGIAESSLTRSGERRIIVELPGVQDPREAAAVIGRTAQLSFHPVLGVAAPAADPSKPPPQPSGEQELVLPDQSGGQNLRLGPPGLTGEGVGGAAAAIDQRGPGSWYVTVDFKGHGQGSWEKLTGTAACATPGDPTRRVAIVLDKQVISSPQVDPSVPCDVGITGGSTQITGSFTQQEAKDLAALIRGGALPVPIQVIEQRAVGPTLGAAAISSSAEAAVIGVVLTALFITVIYRLLGVLAVVALASYTLISYATLAALGATLTLPGLAGFVLAIGVAIDANVLVFERAREEYAANRSKSLRAAVATGFSKAWSAIIDSNVTTLLAAALLFFLASGPVRGFGVTLAIGVLASMVSALLITRVLAEWAVRRRAVIEHPTLSGIAGSGRVRTWLNARDPDLMGHRRRWLAGSAVVLVLAVSGILTRGLDLGVEFTGGRLVEYSTTAPVSVDAARKAVSQAGFPRAVVQDSAKDNISVRTGDLTNDQEVEIRAALVEASGSQVNKERDELIGPSLGDELRAKALIAIAVALGAQLAYLAIRFRWTLGAAIVTAMAHDVLVLVGVFAWLGKPIDGVFLAALLTVIGYSVNDSVVVFDRVRELWGSQRKLGFPKVVNSAILQTIPRTVNTGLGAVFILSALAFLGGDSLTDFAIALLIGIGIGTYSSMFTAGPLAIELEQMSPSQPPTLKHTATVRPRLDRGNSGAVV